MKVVTLDIRFWGDETAFFWKKMPSRTFIATEKSMSGFKTSKGRPTLLSGLNAAVSLS